MFKRLTLLIYNFRNEIIAIILSGLALYYRLIAFAGRKLWNDEFYQFNFMKGPFQPFWEQRVYGDFTCFPGDYLVCYPFLRLFGLIHHKDAFTIPFTDFEKWVIAFPHLVVTILGFWFLYLVCRRHFKTSVGFLVAFAVVCFNNQLIFHALEFRPYTNLAALALAVFYFVGSITHNKVNTGSLKKFLIGIFLVISILFHAYGILIFCFVVLYSLLAQERRGSFFSGVRKNAGYFAAVLCAAFPMWIWYAIGNPLGVLENKTQFDTFTYITNPAVDFVGYMKTIFGNLIGYKKFYFLLLSVGLSFLVSYKEKWNQLMFLLIVIVIPIQVIFLMDLLKGYMFLQRQFIWAMPLFAFFLGWQWDSLTQIIARRFLSKTTFMRT